MLLFRSEEHVARWCRANGSPRRPLVTLAQCWQLARIWYADRLSVASRRPDAGEMVGIFAGVGLEGPFWDPRTDVWRAEGRSAGR